MRTIQNLANSGNTGCGWRLYVLCDTCQDRHSVRRMLPRKLTQCQHCLALAALCVE
jgi:hypothetical protein